MTTDGRLNLIRPEWHFSALSGWLNDPHGVTFLQGVYHLFFQHNPAGPAWSPHIFWGHAITSDFLGFRELQPALRPGNGDEGCWTGALVQSRSEPPLIFFSALHLRTDHGSFPDQDAWETGLSVAVGSPDLRRWSKDPEREVAAGPPAALGPVAFRDPFVRRQDGGWEMLVGVNVPGVGGGICSYQSDDLRSWRYCGLLATGIAGDAPTAAAEEISEEIWECPQLFELDGRWVLVVSVLKNGTAESVQCATGSRDPATGQFIPQRWNRLDQGGEFYAATAFRDSGNRWTLLGWSREGAGRELLGEPQQWAGVLTMPRHITLRADGSPMISPAIDQGRAFVADRKSAFCARADENVVIPLDGRSMRVTLRVAEMTGTGGLAIREAGPGRLLLSVGIDAKRPEARTQVAGGVGPGGQPDEIHRFDLWPEDVRDGGEWSIFLDHSIIELFTGSGACSTHRVYPRAETMLELVLSAGEGSVFAGEILLAGLRPIPAVTGPPAG